jgi:WD40 repeat protein
MQAAVNTIAFSPDGSFLAAGDQNGNLYVWNAATGAVRWRVVELGGAVNGVVFNPDGAFVVAAGAFGNYGARLFDAATGAPGNNFYGNEGPVNSLAFLQDGSRLFSGGADGTIRSWHFPSADTAVTIFAAHDGFPVWCVAVGSGDNGGSVIASGGDDNNLRLWDAATGAPGSDPGVLTGHTGPIASLALLGDWGGITGSLDMTAKIWGGDGGQSNGPTYVSGEIMSQTWTRDGSPYRVTGPIMVPPGETLNIDSGVSVEFAANVPFIVYGGLNVNGGYMDSVRFHGFDSNWGGIRFVQLQTPQKPSYVPYVPSAYLNGVIIEGGSAFGETTAGQSGGGIYVGPGREVYVSGSAIRSNNANHAGGGVFVDGGSLWLSETAVESNSSNFMGGGIGAAGDAYVNLSQSGVRSNYAEMYGGGIAAQRRVTIQMYQSGVRGNTANNEGGGIALYDSVELNMEMSAVRNNMSYGDGGGIFARRAQINGFRSVISGNSAQGVGGAIAADSVYLDLQFMTIATNTAGNKGAALSTFYSAAQIRNSIIWNNTGAPPALNLTFSESQITYSDVQDGWGGTGNISVDPVFMDPANGNYSLTMGSLCIDSADPEANWDPDGTRADMGAFSFYQEGMQKQLTLPSINATPGGTVMVDIKATYPGLNAADLVFTIDRNVFSPSDTNFVRYNVFDNIAGSEPQLSWSMNGDTVRISLASNTLYPAYLQEGVLVTLAFNINPEANYGGYDLRWMPAGEFGTTLNEEGVYMEWGGIQLQSGVVWGDVTQDGMVSGYDASAILSYVVGFAPEGFNRAVADVTDNGFVSSYDAALVLRKVVYNDYLFPVEGGYLPGGDLPKRAAGAPVNLAWERDGAAWVLRASNATGIEAGDVTLTLASDAPINITGDNTFAYKQDGASVQIALVNTVEGGILFRVEGVSVAPIVSNASFNEGALSLAPMLPTAFALEQNAPNPFNPTTTIRFALPEASQVNLVVYDVNGRAIRTLVTAAYQPGVHAVVWDGLDATGRSVASGTYVYRLTTDKGSFVKRMTLMR